MNLSSIQNQSRKEYFLRINRVVDMDKVRQSACITVDEDAKPEGEFGKMHLPGGKYAVGSFKVMPHQFGEAWDAVCRWLADSGYQPSDGYPYEYYPEEHEEGPPPIFTVDICVPVKPLCRNRSPGCSLAACIPFGKNARLLQ